MARLLKLTLRSHKDAELFTDRAYHVTCKQEMSKTLRSSFQTLYITRLKEVFSMLVPYARKNHNVSNFNPFHDFDELERAFFSDNALGEFKADIQEDGDNFVLEADLPGFKKEDIHVDVADDRLTVSAERHSNYEDKDKKGNYLRCERSYGSYARSFDISGMTPQASRPHTPTASCA